VSEWIDGLEDLWVDGCSDGWMDGNKCPELL
jgi:hypothetical protein